LSASPSPEPAAHHTGWLEHDVDDRADAGVVPDVACLGPLYLRVETYFLHLDFSVDTEVRRESGKNMLPDVLLHPGTYHPKACLVDWVVSSRHRLYLCHSVLVLTVGAESIETCLWEAFWGHYRKR